VTERNPALGFLARSQTLELAPADAERLGVSHGDEAEVSSNGTSVVARVAVRARMRPGAGFLIEGTSDNAANVLGGAEVVEVQPATNPVAPGSGSERPSGNGSSGASGSEEATGN
jgi:anaerobic selenocysteine-containing dehydrogenase